MVQSEDYSRLNTRMNDVTLIAGPGVVWTADDSEGDTSNADADSATDSSKSNTYGWKYVVNTAAS